jgi:predicted adenine nucleotide alpha hydrolase (AANH) superfamily ATPase
MKMLVHICCAVCWANTLEGLRAEFSDADLTGFWYNPNIHPLLEYRKRLKALQVFMERDRTPVIIENEYGLRKFCEEIHPRYDAPARCAECYRLRLERTAEVAAERGIPAFTTTMITSSHQDHDLIRRVAEAAAERHAVEFVYRDLRQAKAPEKLLKGIYHQQYCGCVFSEYDRYKDTGKELYRG